MSWSSGVFLLISVCAVVKRELDDGRVQGKASGMDERETKFLP
jgi:hypothetical protein